MTTTRHSIPPSTVHVVDLFVADAVAVYVRDRAGSILTLGSTIPTDDRPNPYPRFEWIPAPGPDEPHDGRRLFDATTGEGATFILPRPVAQLVTDALAEAFNGPAREDPTAAHLADSIDVRDRLLAMIEAAGVDGLGDRAQRHVLGQLPT